MRDPSASVESPSPSWSSLSTVPDADSISIEWTDHSGISVPSRPDKRKIVAAAMLILGVALLFFVPVSAVFFLIAGGIGLAGAWETPHPHSSTDY